MVTLVTAFNGLTAPTRADPSTFAARGDAWMAAFGTAQSQFNTVTTEVNANATAAATAAGQAGTYAANALSYSQDAYNSAVAAASAANAPKWVSGTTYAQGACVWSPLDYRTYRRKVAGAGATDPSVDATNWTLAAGSNGIGAVTTTTGATSVTLTSASSGYQSIAMTAPGKHVALPDATTMSVGGPRFILKNDGGYPFGIRDNAGTLVAAVAAGGIAYVTLKDASTAAGSWSVIGDNLEPGLITIDQTFSSTYASTALKPFVALDANKSIHFLAGASSGIYAVAVDNSSAAVGTPVLIANNGSEVIRSAFRVSSTSCIVFYDDGSSSFAVVISLSGATTLTVGNAASKPSVLAFSAEDFSGAPKIAQLSSTLYLASYTSGTNTSVIAVSVSGTTVTWGTAANIITANSVANSTTTYALTATTGLVLYIDNVGGSQKLQKAAHISVSGTTCTVNSTAGTRAVYSSSSGYVSASCLLSATKCLVHQPVTTINVGVFCFTISGTTVTEGAALDLGDAVTGTLGYTDSSATRYNPHLFSLSTSTALLWYLDGSSVSRAVVLTESGGTVTAGTIAYNTISRGAANAANFGALLPQGTSETLSIRAPLASTAGYGLTLQASKINGTSITAGSNLPLGFPMAATQAVGARLSTGDYVIGGFDEAFAIMAVVRSNGDALNDRGRIKIPPIKLQANPLQSDSNRILLIGAAFTGQTAGSTTQNLRLLNVEICQ